MVDSDLIRAVLGIIGNVLSIGLFASAVPTFYKAVKNDFVEGIKADFYLTTTNCLFFVLYGLPFIHPGNIFLLPAYGIGLAIHLAYLTIFLIYATRQRASTLVIFDTDFVIINFFKARSISVGICCFLIGILTLVLRVDIMLQVRKTKSVECMPFLIVLSDTLNGLCWCIYAVLRHDFFLMGPNLAGFLMGLYELGFYYAYRSTPKSGNDEELAATADEKQPRAKCNKKLSLILEHGKINLSPSGA